MAREDLKQFQDTKSEKTEEQDPNVGASRGVGVFACECGFRGKESELKDGKCPRCGSSVKETASVELRQKAYEKFGGLSYEDYQAKQEKDKSKTADKSKAASE